MELKLSYINREQSSALCHSQTRYSYTEDALRDGGEKQVPKRQPGRVYREACIPGLNRPRTGQAEGDATMRAHSVARPGVLH